MALRDTFLKIKLAAHFILLIDLNNYDFLLLLQIFGRKPMVISQNLAFKDTR